ncbi:MAG: hypothetical protein JRI95_12510 [Deltaproteobacteria bacterium]|nr:hypothetical protein [Deltaproteobacteria bacterium]MBW2084887.1 hypothetical protein [Deltaproteobacteria bacterium]
MKNQRIQKWMRGGSNLYRLTNGAEVKNQDRSIVLCGQSWIIRPMAD